MVVVCNGCECGFVMNRDLDANLNFSEYSNVASCNQHKIRKGFILKKIIAQYKQEIPRVNRRIFIIRQMIFILIWKFVSGGMTLLTMLVTVTDKAEAIPYKLTILYPYKPLVVYLPATIQANMIIALFDFVFVITLFASVLNSFGRAMHAGVKSGWWQLLNFIPFLYIPFWVYLALAPEMQKEEPKAVPRQKFDNMPLNNRSIHRAMRRAL